MDNGDRYVQWHDMMTNSWKLIGGLIGAVVVLVGAGGSVFAWHSSKPHAAAASRAELHAAVAEAKGDRREIIRSIEKLDGKVDQLLMRKNGN